MREEVLRRFSFRIVRVIFFLIVRICRGVIVINVGFGVLLFLLG